MITLLLSDAGTSLVADAQALQPNHFVTELTEKFISQINLKNHGEIQSSCLPNHY